MKKTTISILFFLLSSTSYASIEKEVSGFLDRVGVSNNITGGSAFQDQSAGYYSLGQAHVRTGVKDLQLMTSQLPSVSAGCNGISATFGSFSIFKLSDLQDFGKAALQNAPGVAWNLALSDLSQMFYNEIANSRHLHSLINNTNINSCNAASSMVGGLWPRTAAAEKLVCSSAGKSGGIFDDFAQAAQGCNDPAKRKIVSEKSSPEYQDLQEGNRNIVWKALSKNAMLMNDTELAEFQMTLTGTIIINKDYDGKLSAKYYPAKIENQELISVLFNGGNAKIYQCLSDGGNLNATDPNACLVLGEKVVNISPSDGFLQRIEKRLYNMRDKLKDNIPFSKEEEGIVEALKNNNIFNIVLNNSAKERNPSNIISISAAAEYIAYDLQLEFLISNLIQVQRVIDHMKTLKDGDKAFDQLLLSVRDQRKLLEEKKHKSAEYLRSSLDINKRVQFEESKRLENLTNDLD